MKFLCPSCKAKYQIADEKVDGRNVRMKCRKCGHVIHINGFLKQIVEKDEGEAAKPAADKPIAADKPAAAAKPAAPQKKPLGPRPLGSSPGAPRASAPRASAPRASAPRASTPRASAPGASPRPTPTAETPAPRAGSRLGPRPAARGGLASAAAEALAEPPAAAEPTPAPSDPLAPPQSRPGASSYEDDEAQTVIFQPGQGLAHAFSQVDDAPPSTAFGDAAHDEEWYIGEGGQPIGPLTLADLKEKASSGALDLESLVWKDGFEDWKPVSNYPELVAIVEEFRPSGVVVPLPGAVGAAGVGVATAGPIGAGPMGAGQAGAAGAGVAGDPVFGDTGFGTAPLGAAAGAGAGLDEGIDELAGVPRRSGTPIAAWIAVVAALGLGVAIGVFLLGGQKEVVKIVEKEVPAAGAATDEPDEPTPENPSNDEQPEDPKSGTTQKVAARGPAVKNPKTGEPEKAGGLQGLKGLKGLQGVGPSGPDGPSSAASGGGSQLTADQVQRTVSRYKTSVKRSCWQPALATRDDNAPSTARVSVSINVSPGGSVSSVSTSGDPKGYRGLAGCIAGRVRGWQFPAAGGSTPVNVPFVFAAQ